LQPHYSPARPARVTDDPVGTQEVALPNTQPVAARPKRMLGRRRPTQANILLLSHTTASCINLLQMNG